MPQTAKNNKSLLSKGKREEWGSIPPPSIQMPSVVFYVLDSALGATSLLSTRYAGANFEEQPREYAPPTGVYLRLYGRSREGSSVVVEIQCEQGLSVQFLDVKEDPECGDEDFADNVKRAVLDQLDGELLEKLNPDPDALEDVDLLSATVEYKPCFYGFEPSPTDPLAPRERRVVTLFTDPRHAVSNLTDGLHCVCGRFLYTT